MPAFILALFLVISIALVGWRAIAYLFPYHSSED